MFAEVNDAASEAASRIRVAVDTQDHNAVEREAHRLAGLASNFGLDGLRIAALNLEVEVRAGFITAKTLSSLERAVADRERSASKATD